jgi:hypothetical protein
VLVLGVVLGLAVLVTLGLVFGVRSPWLDERRNRAIAIGVAAIVLLGGFLLVQLWATNEADSEADDVAARLREALTGTTAAQLAGEPDVVVFGIEGIDVSAVVERSDRTVVYAPASALGQDRCVRGAVTTERVVRVTVLDEECPSS